jgi:hypothetical protein
MNSLRAQEGNGDPFSRTWLDSERFEGFMSIGDLRARGVADVPSVPGAYVVVGEGESIEFLEENPAGRFKRRNPTVSLAVLKSKWINKSDTIYIGKGNNLRRRIKQFMDFGAGRPVGHWGGRYTWQVAHAEEMLIAWKPSSEGLEARDLESELLRRFAVEFGSLPFANLTK